MTVSSEVQKFGSRFPLRLHPFSNSIIMSIAVNGYHGNRLADCSLSRALKVKDKIFARSTLKISCCLTTIAVKKTLTTKIRTVKSAF